MWLDYSLNIYQSLAVSTSSYFLQGRGTQNPITGPPRDHSSSQGEALGGAYVFLDSSFPRRPGDVGRLESIEFQATGEFFLF